MILTAENYFSDEANKEYMSVSQFKSFVGMLCNPSCEAKAVAMMNKQYKEPMSVAMTVGSYVDAYFEGTLEQFKLDNPHIFLQRGEGKGTELKVEYRKANEIIDRIKADTFFMKLMSGEKQKIVTFELFGVMWKAKYDSYLANAIVDLKVMKSIRDLFWTKFGKMSFVEYWGYDIQASVYREGDKILTGKHKPFIIACASKEEITDLEAIGFSDEDHQATLAYVEAMLPHAVALKNGKVEPVRCEKCDYCKATKKLSKVIHFSELTEKE